MGLRTTALKSIHWPLAASVVAATLLLVPTSCAESDSAPPPSEPGVESTTSEAAKGGTSVPRSPVTHEFVIPAGTSTRLSRGEDVGIIPKRLQVHVGDKIKVRNDDVRLARLGLFDVAPGETVSMAFNTPGEMEGVIFSDESGGCGAIPKDADTFIVEVLP